MKFPVLALALTSLLANCAADVSSEASCDDATNLITECYGEEVGSAYQCDPETAADVADSDCAELAAIDDKSDGTTCQMFGFGCPSEPLFPNPTGDVTKYPIVLAHGFNGSPENEWGVNPNIIAALRADGQQVYVARVSPFKSVEFRGGELAAEIDKALAEFETDKVNLIAHSMGGLDSRFAISSLGYNTKVASLVTIASPHHGTLVADAALGLIPEFADDTVNALTRAFARTFTDPELASDSDLRDAFTSLAENSSEAFNAANPDVIGVYYQSWAGVSNLFRIPNPKDITECTKEGGKMYLNKAGTRDFMDSAVQPMAAIVSRGTFEPNDGMSTVASARHGDFKGCIPTDHYDQVGQNGGLVTRGDEGVDPATGFEASAFYQTIAFDLAARGY